MILCLPLIRKLRNVYKMVDFLVRFAALISLCGLVTGYSADNFSLQIAEVVMLFIWLFSDMHHLKKLAMKIKEYFKG